MLKRDLEPLPAQQLAAQSAGRTQLPCRLFCQRRGGRIGRTPKKIRLGIWEDAMYPDRRR
jgi:hypothetical protein